MTDARAFPYARYDEDEVGDPGLLLAPPYDVIDAAARAELAAKSPYQSVLVELPERGDARAAGELLRSWIDEGALALGEVGVAVIRQRYVGPDSVRRTRVGVLCEVALHDFAEGKVQPHEQTFEAPRRARLELMREVGANVSPVFLLYHDGERSLDDLFASVTDDAPDFTSTDADGTQTAVWFVTDVALCERFAEALAPHPFLIADGHHRYTAALAYRDEVRAAPQRMSVVGGRDHVGPPHTSTSGPEGVLAVVCNSADEGICVFPTHRVLTGADVAALDRFVLDSGALQVSDHPDVAEAMAALEALESPGFVVYAGGAARLFAAGDPTDLEIACAGRSEAYRSLDVVALHALVLDGGAMLAGGDARIAYTRSLDEALDLVDGADGGIGFLLRSTDVRDVHRVAEAGELLPQKSTYFYPKVPTGVAYRLLDPIG